jgi:dsRNA-specific ribonuclease
MPQQPFTWLPTDSSPPCAQVQSPGRVAIEEHLNYDFRNRALLAEALTHCSWPNPAVPCYQRLEFLGDAVLDVLVTRHLYHAHP